MAHVPAKQRGFFALGIGVALLAVLGGTGATMVAVQQDSDSAVASAESLDSSPVIASVAPHESGNE